ncbi:GTP cyclohydrolase II [Roseinatronobacter monicus]|uniref:GTP cyclohydrolase II n=1 Tax=Roseinatronobacter monicus TaxID=393481 RepID=UPI003F336707
MNAVTPGRVAEAPATSAFAPHVIERVMRVKGDLRLGVPVVLTNGPDAAMVIAVEMLTPERYAAVTTSERKPQIALTRHRMAMLGLEGLPKAKVLGMTLPADANLAAISAMADPALSAAQVAPNGAGAHSPKAFEGGAIHRAAIALAKSAQLLPAALILPLQDALAEAVQHGLCVIDAAEVLSELAAARFQRPVSTAALPMAAHQAGRVHVFRPNDGSIEHYAIEIGTPDPSRPVLVRLHSACFTGDVLGSLKCDCGPQLQSACTAMAKAGGGVLLYLNQEGRGIGMANKMRAYALQDHGFDTVEANHHLGFDDDERDFRNGSALLKQLGITSVRLLTNNPAKVAILRNQGITVVERVPLVVGQTAQNAHYLATKVAKSGHVLK